MATCDRVINRALQKCFAIDGGATPDGVESSDALETLQSVYNELLWGGAFGRMIEVSEDAAYTAEENESIGNSTDSNITITLPETVDDEFAEDGTRRPYDLTPVRIVGSAQTWYLYDGWQGAWVRCSDLALSDEAPLSERSVDGLSGLLAMRQAEEFSLQAKPGALAAAQKFHSLLTHKLDRPRRETEATYY